MIRPALEVRVHLCCEAVDFRKQMRGLSVLVQEELELDPFSTHLFAFCNRRREQASFNIPIEDNPDLLSLAPAAR